MDAAARETILINQVVAWHNRHPLARRISRADVTGVGVVALPFVGPQRAADRLAAGRLAGTAPALRPPDADAPVGPGLTAGHAEQEAALLVADTAVDASALAALLADDRAGGRAGSRAGDPAGEPAGDRAAESPTDALAGADRPVSAGRRSGDAPLAGAAAGAKRGAAGAGRWAVPVFSENFVPPLRPAAVARWASRHAQLAPPDARDGPLREVPVDSGLRRLALRGRHAALHTRYVRSAAIELTDVRLRCLIGAAPRGQMPPILGPRIWDRQRVGLAVLVGAVLLAGLAGAAWWRWRASAADAGHPGPVLAASAPAASDAAGLSAASAPAPAPAEPAHAAASGEALAPAVAASTAAGAASAMAEVPHGDASGHAAGAGSAAAPAAAAVMASAVPASEVRAVHGQVLEAIPDEARSQIKEASDTARAAWAAQQEKIAERRARRNDPEQRPVAGLQKGAPVFALMAPPSSSRAEAEQQLKRLKTAASMTAYSSLLKFEVLESGAVYQAAWFPFIDRQGAERTQAQLAARGMKVELVDF